MAHIKVAVGLVLACAICAQALPADFGTAPSTSSPFGVGSSSFEPVRPLGGSGGSTFGQGFQQGTTRFPVAASTVNRFVRDESHEQANGHSATTESDVTSHPERREATTVEYKRPLPAAPTTHSANRREASTVRPVVLPGSLAASSASTAAPKEKREEPTTAKATVAPHHKERREEPTTAKATIAPHHKERREEASTVKATVAPHHDDKREATTLRHIAIKPLVLVGAATTAKPKPFGTTEKSSFLSVSNKNRRQVAPLSADDEDERQAQGGRPTLIPRPSRPFRRTTPSTASEATSTESNNKNKRESSSTVRVPVRPLNPGSSTEQSTFGIRNKRQIPLTEDDERQLAGRPTLIPRPNGRPTRPARPNVFRRTTPSAPSSSSTRATPSTTTGSNKFKRDVFYTTERPFTVETFHGADQSLPGQSTYFTGTNVNGQRPDGQHFVGSSIASTSFSTNPQNFNKRQADGDGDDSSSGEDNQEFQHEYL
ncbi:mucin-2-like isoform X2 [Neocloeon triangulifer]|uniref:mucin-2-like isoform X2 n=1 Tax=Neocloeon triangulifer TaxID=2078957 RepID=UPI00286ED81C|nr:mucin-2-like isoform X2 [Neocloeon triangulifer]